MPAAAPEFTAIRPVPTAGSIIEATAVNLDRELSDSDTRQSLTRKLEDSATAVDTQFGAVLADFERVTGAATHAFFRQLMAVLYDDGHLATALRDVAAVRAAVTSIAAEYNDKLGVAENGAGCVEVARVALQRIAEEVTARQAAFVYLEQVRAHAARLPSVDPEAPTLLLAGFPNVGKSSFMNRVTRADVDVQPYAFTTKSLYVGHTTERTATAADGDSAAWQVINMPGLLDHELEHRSAIEMQAVTALAHLQAAVVLFFVDLSMQCGYTISQQLSLLGAIGPLLAGRPLIVVLTKSDLVTLGDVAAEDRDAVNAAVEAADAATIAISAVDCSGVAELQRLACRLAQQHGSRKATGDVQPAASAGNASVDNTA